MSIQFRYWLGVTDDLSDADFESVVAHIRTVRSARREAVALERQWHTATGGISARYAEMNSPAAVRRELIASYRRAGMTFEQIELRLSEMDGR